MEDLEIHQFDVDAEAAAVLADCPALKTLDITADETALPELGKLTTLETLELVVDADQLGADALNPLANLSNLSELNLSTMILHDSQPRFDFLGRLPALKKLTLHHQLTDDRAAFLGELATLESLRLENALLGDEGLAMIGKLTGLKTLSIESPSYGDKHASFTAAGLRELSGMSELTTLSFTALPLNDDAVAALAVLPQLTKLRLSGAAITDAGMEQFKQFENLAELHLYRCNQVTREKIEQLKKDLPEVKISAF